MREFEWKIPAKNDNVIRGWVMKRMRALGGLFRDVTIQRERDRGDGLAPVWKSGSRKTPYLDFRHGSRA